MPPQPSDAVPPHCKGGHGSGFGVQPHWFEVWQVFGEVHGVLHVTTPPQPSGAVPAHCAPHAAISPAGVQPHRFATPLPPQVWGIVHPPQLWGVPQLSLTVPQTPDVHGFTGEHAAWQVPPTQFALWQSPSPAHGCPFGQPGQGPPQSVPVSPSLRIPSLHVPPHAPQTPPQSTPVSLPAFTVSWQPHAGFVALPLHVSAAGEVHSLSGSAPAAIGPHTPSSPLPFLAWVHATQVPLQDVSQQTPSTQAPAPQLVVEVHGAPRQVVGHGPPQSTPLSPWFFRPSWQFPVQGGHEPPQSIAVSSPSCLPSRQPRSLHIPQPSQPSQTHLAIAR